MTAVSKRRPANRTVFLDRSLEELPLFRLSDTTDDPTIDYATDDGGRWRVLASPGERLPGTLDQDVYIELMRRYHEAGEPADGGISFTLHSFLRAMDRQVDGRTYAQLRAALARLERTTLQSEQSYFDSSRGSLVDSSFTLLSAVSIERRRIQERDQLQLFGSIATSEPGEARVVLSALIRQNITGRHTVSLSLSRYLALQSPVARRLYRLLEVARSAGTLAWRVSLDRLRDQLPLAQRYPSHLLRVLEPAHEMLKYTGVIREALVRQQQREWFVDYVLGGKQ
jgi:plasmid replication initiation protein